MSKMKVITIVGTRPEIIRLSCVIEKLDKYCDHYLIHTGQNYDYELSEIFFSDLGIRKPDIYLNCAGRSAIETIASIIVKVDEVLEKHRPDAVLVLGDTNSCLSIVSAKRRKIPIFHMEAGNRCFDMRVPEEINRRIVDHTADVNLTYSSIARQCLINEGLPTDLIIKTGSPMFEVLQRNRSKIEKSNVCERLGLASQRYFVFSAHREENVDSSVGLKKLINLMNGVAERYRLPIVVSTHPRTLKRLDALNPVFCSEVNIIKPLCFTDYVALQQKARVVLSDSGTISEESSILNYPALNLRETQERHEALEEGAVMLVGLELSRVEQCINILDDQPRGNDRMLSEVVDYTVPNVSEKIVRIIHSMTDYVNRVVWRKYN